MSDGTRTRDILDHNQVLYQLSYAHQAPAKGIGSDRGRGAAALPCGAVLRSPVLIALTAVGALVRFATLDAQSYWYDEALTFELVNDSFGGMLDGVFAHEAQPPPYFVLAWLWVKVFGAGEVGLRSLSALFGTLTVPVAYEAARRVGGARVALVTGVLTALSPPLVWYSQEARAYALVAFLGAVALLFFVRALDGYARRDLVVWAVATVLAVATHYFALFLALPMGLWLLLRAPSLRRIVPYLAAVAVGLLAVAPMLLHQQEHGGVNWIGDVPIRARIREIVFFFAFGPGGLGSLHEHRGVIFLLGGLLFALVAGAALAWSEEPVRRRLVPVLVVGLAVFALAFAARVVGSDYVLERNFLPALIPLTIALAVGLCLPRVRRLGTGLAVVAALAFAAVVIVETPHDEQHQRDDWRALAARIGPPSEDRIVSVAPHWHGKALRVYLPGLDYLQVPGRVRTIYTAQLETFVPFGQAPAVRAPPPPFRETRVQRLQYMTVREYTAPEPVMIDPAALRTPGRNGAGPLFQAAG